jgi:hypothetical protein
MSNIIIENITFSGGFLLQAEVPPPTGNISSNVVAIASGASVALTWQSTNATTATASGSWTGTKQPNGTETVGPITSNSTYSITFSGPGGTATANTSVAVVPAPTGSISSNAASVTSGNSILLTWTSTNATSAVASGSWSGSKATSGSETVTVTSNSTYSITFTGVGGNTTANTSVTVTPSGGEAIFLADPGTVQTTTWNVPSGVERISMVCIGTGGAGSRPSGGRANGGAGGNLRWTNDIPVVPPTANSNGGYVTVQVPGGSSGSFPGTGTVIVEFFYPNGGVPYATLSTSGTTSLGTKTIANFNGTGQSISFTTYGGNGGNGGPGGTNTTFSTARGGGGGGAGGYFDDGGRGGNAASSNSTARSGLSGSGGGGGGGGGSTADGVSGGSGGGSGLYGVGADGAGGGQGGFGGSGGSGGTSGGNQQGNTAGYGGSYGGGGGGSAIIEQYRAGPGAVRFIWGPNRSFPNNAGPQ